MGILLLVSMIQSDRERLHRLATERKEIVDGKIKVTAPRHVDKTTGAQRTSDAASGVCDRSFFARRLAR